MTIAADRSITIRRVAVRPIRNTVGYIVLLLAMWYAAISQGNGAAYALFFFLAALGAVSWLHTRRNLRGLTISAGRVDPVFAGTELHIPLTVTASSGSFAAGLEIRPIAGGESGRIGFIRAGETLNTTVTVRTTERGVFPTLELEVRSLWPVGIYAARARIKLDSTQIVHPAPEGSEPLPEGEPGWQHERRRGRGDGDEFAGLREIRPGENPRRIHWRAAERSEILLIKEWEGAAGGLRWLDWQQVRAASTEEKLSQLSRWILEADRSGAPYGLRMPGAEISPGMGPAHRSRCLKALAAFPADPSSTPVKKRRSRAKEMPILPRPFAMLLVALGFATVPLVSTILPFSAALLGLAIVGRFLTRKRGTALRSIPAKLVFCGVGVGGVLFSGSGILGLQPGMSLLVGLMALKILESTTRRDFFVLMLLAWFLSLCGLFVSQTLVAGLAAAGISVLAGLAGAQLYSDDQIPRLLSFRRMGLIAAQALPIVALLFIFFPRFHAGIRFALAPGGLGAAGFSEDFEPGSFAQLNDNFDTAFRVEFIGSDPPNPADRYWRGVVLWECRGLSWRRGRVQAVEPIPTTIPEGAFRQRITLQPHGKQWLFALDRPVTSPREGIFEPGATIRAYRSINRSTRYEVYSATKFTPTRLPKQQLNAALSLPESLPQETRKLADSLKASGSDREILMKGIEWFRAQEFTYSLSPQTYEGAGALDEFLFRRRTGFCSHYAGAFATLMRAAGLPARVVLGYQGGEYNPNGRYFQIRQNDAHAWAEVWIEGAGWQRIDLTQQIAPERIENGAARYRETAAESAGGTFRAPAGLRDLFDRARMAWDSLNYEWDLRVVAYDEDAQFEFLAKTGLKDVPKPVMVGGIMIGTSLLLGVAALWLRRATRNRRDPAGEVWSKACAQIARISGIAREAWEGPHAYGERAAAAVPHAAAEIRDAAALYSRLRFSPEPPELAELQAATLRLQKTRKKP